MKLNFDFLGRILALIILITIESNVLFAQVYPNGFSEVQLATNVSNGTAMAFAPDGRLFICRKNGEVLIFKNGAINSQPFISISTNQSGERGLLGIAFDPDFSTNKFIYFYYTISSATRNRVSRFKANGDVVLSGSETVLLELDPLSSATNHNAGALKFGLDGTLYICVGDNHNSANSQNLDTYHGKILRINSDGTVPTGNPYTTGTAQKKRVWAYGLRNPFTFDIQPLTGKIFVNDVGLNDFEEINDATVANRNFGWPNAEGTSSINGYTNPVYDYSQGLNDSMGCAITGGVFFNPVSTNYPSSYIGKYFFTDYCGDWINMIDFSQPNVTRSTFASSIDDNPVALTVGIDGNLYFLSRITNCLNKVIYQQTASAPVITEQPKSVSLALNKTLTLTTAASGTAPFSFQWTKNGIAISGATLAQYNKNNVNYTDSGNYKCIVSNAYGSVITSNAKVTINNNTPPIAQIVTPTSNNTYGGNETITFSGTGTDFQNGNLPASAFNWYVEFHHDTHKHPGAFIQPGITSGSFVTANTGEVSDNVFYRLYLVVTDADGAVDTAFVDIFPRKSYISLYTNPPGLMVNLDGIPVQTPVNVLSVEGLFRNIAPNTPQLQNSTSYVFDGWSVGGASSKTFVTPQNDTAFTANYIVSYRFADNPQSTVNGLYYKYYLGSWNAMPDFNSLATNKEGTIATFDYSPRTVSDNFAFRFNGYIEVPKDSIYTFYTSSDDGSMLYIGNVLVVDNDGLHPTQERSGSIGLKAGKHLIRVEYFEKTGGQVFIVNWSGPGIAKQNISASNLYRLAGSINKSSTQDAYVRSGSYNNNTMGQSDPSKLYSKFAAPSTDVGRETYILFDITGFTNEFTSITVDLYGKLRGSDLTNACEVICVPLANTFWQENTITNSNKPLSTIPSIDYAYINDYSGKYYKFDVTEYVLSQMNSGISQVAFIIKGSYEQNNYAVWNSEESSGNDKPRMVFSYAAARAIENNTIEALDTDIIKIYPNPSNGDDVTIALPTATKAEVIILDIQGRIVKQLVADSERTSISVSNLQAGMYFVQIIINEKRISKKLQIIK